MIPDTFFGRIQKRHLVSFSFFFGYDQKSHQNSDAMFNLEKKPKEEGPF